MHRGYQRINSKLITHNRNYIGRLNREIIHFNEGIATSAQMINDEIGYLIRNAKVLYLFAKFIDVASFQT